jgi:hypothetical protein
VGSASNRLFKTSYNHSEFREGTETSSAFRSSKKKAVGSISNKNKLKKYSSTLLVFMENNNGPCD